jgi:hypothetical protein
MHFGLRSLDVSWSATLWIQQPVQALKRMNFNLPEFIMDIPCQKEKYNIEIDQ